MTIMTTATERATDRDIDAVPVTHPHSGHHIGYIRVSTVIQSTERQLDGISLHKVFEDKASAKDTNRPQLQACMEYLREGDTLHVHSIDRLARNLRELQEVVTTLNGRGISVQFHKENMLFGGRGDDSYQKLMFQILGAFAEFERSMILERQKEGIAKAKAQGKYKGRKAKLTAEQVRELKAKASEGTISKAQLAREYGISRQTLYSYLG
jgi:DNA invertase Pin-like site-specific DNA recombinase